MKKIISILLSLILLSNISLPAVFAAGEATRPVTHGNDIIEFSVNNKGRFNIRTTELGNPIRPNDSRKSLLFYDGKNETSFTTFRINGEDYIFGENYAFSLSKKANLVGKTVKIDDSIVTTYQIGSGDKIIKVIQTLSIINDPSNTNYGNVYIQYALKNETGENVNIGARILQDVMIGENDGCAIKVEDNFYDKEIEFTGKDVPDIWRATDNEFAPNVVGYGYTNGWGNTKPNKLIIGHWQGLSQTAYDYTVNNDVNFTIESDYGSKDTAIAYYWEPKKVENNETINFETYFGLGQILERELTFATNISAPTQMVVNEAKTGYVNNGEFEVAVMIENNLPNSEEIYDVMGYLTFDDGGKAVSLNNDAALKGTKLIKKGGQYTFRWKLKAKAGVEYNAIKYKVDLYDRRNVYQEGDEIPKGKKVGDVKLDEIYSVSKALILPSKTGAPPQITFGTISPNEIYYSGKNLVSVKCSGIPLLMNKENWELQYRVNNGSYEVVPSKDINVVPETNSLEIMFEKQFDVGEMDFRIKILNNLYDEGADESKHILKDDILKIPGRITISKDKAVMPRTYGMLAIVSDFTCDSVNDITYNTHAIPLKDENELKALKKALKDANEKDKKDIGKTYEDTIHKREVLMEIRGDIRAVRDNGQLSKYVVYAQHKKAIINNIITYTSAIPITIQYNLPTVNVSRNTIEYFSGKKDGMSDTLKNILIKDTTIDDNFLAVPDGTSTPEFLSDTGFDFSYVENAADTASRAKQTMDFIKGVGDVASGNQKLQDLISNDVGKITVTGLGVLGINSGDGFDFWMDMFTVEFADDQKYSLWDVKKDILPVRFNLEGIGAVLNKALDGLPVQIGGVRLVQDREKDLDMLTFDATVDLTMLPGNVIVNAKDIFFSTKGYEGLIVNANAAPDEPIGIVSDMRLNVGVDTYNGAFSIKGEAQIKVVKCEVEFSMIKESKNDTWYLSSCVLAGGGKPGIPLFAGAAYITKLGGGIRNLEQITNPYYKNTKGDDGIFTVVALMDLSVVEVLEGSFEGNFTKRYMKIKADKASIMDLDIFRDMEVKLSWDTGGPELFYLSAKGSVDIWDVFRGDAKLYISDIFFEGTCKVTVKIPDKVPVVGGHKLGKVFFGVNNDKMWGAMKIDLLLFSVEVGATYWWRGKIKFHVGEAGPIAENENLLSGPTGGLYQGTTLDDKGEKVDFIIGTNVEAHDGKINNNSLTEMRTLVNSVDKDYIGSKTPLNISENKYHHNDISLEGKYVYDIKADIENNTKLVFEYQGENKPNIILCTNTKEHDIENADIIKNSAYNLESATHVYDNKNYQTFIGFDSTRKAEEFVVVSDTELTNYITYTDTISDDIGSEYIYQITMDTTENTKLAFSHDGEFEVDVYKLTGTTFDGKEVVGEKDSSLKQIDTIYNNKNIKVIEGFEAGLKGAKFYVSSNKELTKHNVLDAHVVDVQDSHSKYGSNMVAEFVSEESIKDADVFYITDADNNIIKLPEGDISTLYNERITNDKTYHTMIFPFEKNGKYYVYSTAKIDKELSKVYEIEKMPQLEKDSVRVKENSLSDQKLDISWEGSNYRYTADENKKTGRTVFSFYLVDDSEIATDDDGELEDEVGVLLGLYNIEEGGVNSYTVDIPKGTPTGDYRIKVVLGTEGLCQKFEYSDVIKYVNEKTPKNINADNIKVSSIGNGFLDVSWNDKQNVDEYYIEVFDEKMNIMDSFGVASVKGDARQAIIGGVYETFNPEKPEKSTVSGLETGKAYIVGLTPVKKVDEATKVVGETAYSEKIFLPDPAPAKISIDFGDENAYTKMESSFAIDEDGKVAIENNEVKGVNKKSPLLTIKTDQEATFTILLDKVKLQTKEKLSEKVELQLDKLTEGVHYLDVVAKNEKGDISHETFKFHVDTRGPELLINTPVNNEVISSDKSSVTVSGKTEVEAKITVNGVSIPVDDKGVFEGRVPVDTENVKTLLSIEASDGMNNVTKNKIEVIRNIAPIKDIVISTDIPRVTKTIKKPIYKATMETMKNVFTGQEVEVPMTTDEVIGYDEDVITENIVKMGKSYKFDVKGVPEALQPGASVSSADYVDIDKSKLKYEILEGKTLASIDDNGVLSINNNGVVVVRASYEVLSDHDNVKGYSFDKYITMTSEFADIYTDIDDDNDKDQDTDTNKDKDKDKHKNKDKQKEQEKIYTEKDKVSDSIYVAPAVFKNLKDNTYKSIIIDTNMYTVVMENPKKSSKGEDTVINGNIVFDDSTLSVIPEEEQTLDNDEIITPLSSIDMSLTLDSPKKDEILEKINEFTKVQNGEVATVHFRHHGKLPTKAKVRASLGREFKSKNLYIYYYNKEADKLELYGYVISNEHGDIRFEIDHCSDYVFIEDININNSGFVEDKATKAYISGYPDGNFAPNKYITRAEVAAMISKLLDDPDNKNTITFSDDDVWAKEYIHKLAAYGYINGYQDGSFKPNNYITRAELAKILINIVKPKRTQSFRAGYFTDIKDSWAKKEIMQCYRLGLINGYDGKFDPNGYATRAAAVTMINNLTCRNDDIKDKTNPFHDLNNSHWAFDDILRAIK
ncbi:S-layer homology domain-containing protein [Abyssisolibacter fermentans]|uniref:S-layer homology domain-containing protein n=1 Tax=Abyssisolibacter fermentans TaxID=1766203 RepID=UPI000832A110|nr:S-layer homology domain-containing protein [Abyssisolibacter fermentans]